MGTVEQASWFNDYEDVQQAYDLKTGDGTYVGWLWQSKDRDYIDLANVTHANVRSEATNIILSIMEGPFFRLEELEAWKYLNDTFFAPAELDYDFYDLSQVRVRHEKVFSYADPAEPEMVNEHIFLQLDLPGQNNAARVGFDITNGKYMVFEDNWPDTTSETYAADMAAHANNAVDVGTTLTADVKLKVEEIMDVYFYDRPLADDFYSPVVVPPDANYDVVVDAYELQSADDAFKAMMQSLSAVPINSVSEANEGEFTFTVSDGTDTFVGTISSSNVVDFGSILKTYADDNGIMLDEIVDELDIFVEDALRSVDEFGDSVAYTASYSRNGTSVMTADMEDADDLANWEPMFMLRLTRMRASTHRLKET